MFLCFLFLSWVSHERIAKQRFIASMTGALNWPVNKTYSECHSEKDGFGFLWYIRKVSRGSFLPVVITPGALGFAEKILILKETIFSLGEVKAFAYCSSKQNSINCRGCSTALSIPQSIMLTCGVCELPAQLQRQMETKPGQTGHAAEAGEQNQMDLLSRETLAFTE